MARTWGSCSSNLDHSSHIGRFKPEKIIKKKRNRSYEVLFSFWAGLFDLIWTAQTRNMTHVPARTWGDPIPTMTKAMWDMTNCTNHNTQSSPCIKERFLYVFFQKFPPMLPDLWSSQINNGTKCNMSLRGMIRKVL